MKKTDTPTVEETSDLLPHSSEASGEGETQESWDLLSGLPDLALRRLLDYLTPQHGFLSGTDPSAPPPHGFRTAARAAGEVVEAAQVPSVCRVRARHAPFLKEDEYTGGSETENERQRESEEERSEEEETRFMLTLPFDGDERAGSIRDLLALRLTCRRMQSAVDAAVQLPMDVLWKVDQCLQAQFPEPPLADLITDTPRGLERAVESLSTGRANAHLHQLRLKEVLAYVCDEWELPAGKKAEIDAVLDLAEEEPKEEHQRARLRLEHFEHASAFFGEQAGLHTESVLSLSLPGKPQEVVQLFLYVAGAESVEDPASCQWDARPSGWGQVVGLSLGTRSLEWIRLLGLEPPQQKKNTKADDRLNLELTCSVGGQRCVIEDDTLLKLWSALGFGETVASESRSGEADRWSTKKVLERRANDSKKKEENETKWSACEVLVLLYACLGLAWKPDVERTFEEAASDNSDDEMNDDEDIEFLVARKAAVLSVVLRNHRLESPPVLDLLRNTDAYFATAVQNQEYCEGSLVAKCRRWEFVTRAIRRFFGQRRLAMLPAALKTALNLEADHGIDLRPADGSHLFDRISFISGSEFGFRLPCARDKQMDSFSVRFLVRVGSGGDCLVFHCDERTGFGRGLKRLAVDVVGSRLQEKIADKLGRNPYSDSDSDAQSQSHPDSDSPERPTDQLKQHHLNHQHHELYRVVGVGQVEVSDTGRSLLQVVGQLLELPPSDGTTKEQDHHHHPECAGGTECSEYELEVQTLLTLISAVLQSDSFPVTAEEVEESGKKRGKEKQKQRKERQELELAQRLIAHMSI